MNVSELIEILEDMDQDAEVRLAFQPNWPFEHSIGQVADMSQAESYCEECEILWDAHSENKNPCDEERPNGEDENQENVVYIAEGGQMGYLPGNASESLGWR